MGGGTRFGYWPHRRRSISIHPPCGGRDCCSSGRPPRQADFNPPALWGAGPSSQLSVILSESFQSTRPVGGGTRPANYKRPRPHDFNPPALWGAGPHSRGEFAFQFAFQSTRPVGGGTGSDEVPSNILCISIHPPCGGRDFYTEICIIGVPQFLTTRPLGGGTPASLSRVCRVSEFQSTRPVGGGTGAGEPVTEEQLAFQSTRPVGGGTAAAVSNLDNDRISIHPPCGGAGPRNDCGG